jgi:CheY-like chemotaxis protein
MSGRPRIVIATPLPAEREVLATWLASEGFEPVQAATPQAAAEYTQSHPFDLLIADAGFALRDGLHAATRGRTRNPRTPAIVIGDPDDSAAEAQAERRGAMYLPRPVDQATLVCTVSMLMMEARPARRSPRRRVSRLEVAVDGVPAYIIDVSLEGLRLEIPRQRRWAPPPYYNVRVPILGVGLMVQRMWTARPSVLTSDVNWCGGLLGRNSPRVEQAWRTFVDAVGAGTSAGPLQLQ